MGKWWEKGGAEPAGCTCECPLDRSCCTLLTPKPWSLSIMQPSHLQLQPGMYPKGSYHLYRHATVMRHGEDMLGSVRFVEAAICSFPGM